MRVFSSWKWSSQRCSLCNSHFLRRSFLSRWSSFTVTCRRRFLLLPAHPRPSCTCREPSLQSEVNISEEVGGWIRGDRTRCWNIMDVATVHAAAAAAAAAADTHFPCKGPRQADRPWTESSWCTREQWADFARTRTSCRRWSVCRDHLRPWSGCCWPPRRCLSASVPSPWADVWRRDSPDSRLWVATFPTRRSATTGKFDYKIRKLVSNARMRGKLIVLSTVRINLSRDFCAPFKLFAKFYHWYSYPLSGE